MTYLLQKLRDIASSEKVKITFPEREFQTSFLDNAKVWDVRDGGAVFSDGPLTCKLTKVTVTGKGARLFIASDAVLDGTKILVRGRDCVLYIGPGCRFKKADIHVRDTRCSMLIGAGTTWESGAGICYKEDQHIVIGDDCMLSNSVIVRTDDGHAIFDRDSQERVNLSAPVVLEPHVWLGNGARVNKGTRIGAGTVLAGASVASKRLDAHCVYAGIPARKLRENVAWSRTMAWGDIPDEYR